MYKDKYTKEEVLELLGGCEHNLCGVGCDTCDKIDEIKKNVSFEKKEPAKEDTIKNAIHKIAEDVFFPNETISEQIKDSGINVLAIVSLLVEKEVFTVEELAKCRDHYAAKTTQDLMQSIYAQEKEGDN